VAEGALIYDVGTHKDDRLTILNIAVSNNPDKVDFYVDEQKSVWGTMNLD